MPRAASGFATASMLLLAGILAAAALWSTSETLTTRALGTARQVQVRAAALTEGALGVARDMVRLDPIAGTSRWRWQSPTVADEQVRAESRRTFTQSLPPGFSAGHFAGYDHEIMATGTSSRGAQAARTIGITVIYPAESVP